MSEKKPDKGHDKSQESPRSKETPNQASREETIRTTDQQQALEQAQWRNRNAIKNGESVGEHLQALKPTSALTIDYGDGNSVTAADAGKNNRNREKRKLTAESLDSGTMKALEQQGPEPVRQVMRNLNQIRQSLKEHVPQGESRDKLDRDLKKSAIESLTDAGLVDSSGNVEPAVSILQRFEKISKAEISSRDAAVPKWVPRLNESYEHRGEVREAAKPHGEGPSGTLVWKDKGGYHELRCAAGRVLDGQGKPIGDIKYDGTLVLHGQTIKIDATGNKEHFMFLGKDSHGAPVKLLANSDANKLTGKLTSFDGKTSYAVVAGNIFDCNGVFKGHVDGSGHVEPVKGKSGPLGNDADINTLFNRHKFEGLENGKPRFFVSTSDMCNGTMMIPSKQIPGGKGDTMVKIEVRSGMLLDPYGKQIGVLFAPHIEGGKLDGGLVVFSGSKKPLPLCELQNASFDLRILGESGHRGRNLKGLCLGWQAGGKGGLFDVQAALDVSASNRALRVNKLEDASSQGLGIFKWAVDGVTGQRQQEKQAAIDSDSKLHAELDSMVKHGVTEPSRLKDLMLLVETEGQVKNARPQASADGQVGVPTLSAALVAKVDGMLILDNSAFAIKHGQLYRVHDDGHGNARADLKAAGRLLGNYRIQLDGVGEVDLSGENRVLMKFTIAGDKATHRVVGMGKSRVTEGGIAIEGGLVSVDDLSRKAKAAIGKEVQSNEDYLKHKDVLTNLTQGASDLLMGGKADASLSSSKARFEQMTNLFDKACDKLFAVNPVSGDVNTKLIDHHIGTVQTVMDTFGLEIADQQRTRGDLRQAQATMNEALSMSAVTVATMGVGTLVSSFANAGKFATMGRFAHAASIGSRVGGGAIAGGTIRAVGGHHDGESGAELAGNFASGALEGGVMAALNLTSSFERARKLSKGLGLPTSTEVVAGKVVPKAIGEVDTILAGGGIKQTEAWLLKSGIGRASVVLTDGQAQAAKIGLGFVDNFTQSATFGVSNYFRSRNNQDATSKSGPLNAGEIALGTVTGMLSHGAGEFFSRDSRLFKQINDSLPPEARLNFGDAAEHLVTQAPRQAASGFTVGVFNAVPTEFDKERQMIAAEQGVDASAVGLKEIIEYDRLAGLINRVAEGASLNALASLPGSLAHGLVEKNMALHTEEYLSTPQLGKAGDSIFKPLQERTAKRLVDDLLAQRTMGGANRDAVERDIRALGWSPATLSKIERYNDLRQAIASLPQEMHGELSKLLGDVSNKGLKSPERLNIVENLFKIYDTTTAEGAGQLHDVAVRMNECMKSFDREQSARAPVPKLEEIFDRDEVALIRAMDAAQAKLKPIEITEEEHSRFVDESYERARKKAPGERPARDRILHLVVGPPGAGKSSSLVNPFKNRDRCMEIDSDDVKPTVAGYIAKFRGMDHVGFGAGIVHPVSSKVAHDVLMRAMDNGDNIIHPILGRTPEGVLDLVTTAKSKGYKVAIHIADVPPELSSRRAFDRGQKEVDKEGKRQMVPATYSLDSVKWGPQITFDRISNHLEGFIDEMNYCNTNIPKEEIPEVVRRSPRRIREGVEHYIGNPDDAD